MEDTFVVKAKLVVVIRLSVIGGTLVVVIEHKLAVVECKLAVTEGTLAVIGDMHYFTNSSYFVCFSIF